MTVLPLLALCCYGLAIPALSLVDWQHDSLRSRVGRGALWSGVVLHVASVLAAFAQFGLSWIDHPDHAIAIIALTCALIYAGLIRNPRWHAFAGVFLPMIFFLQLISVAHDQLTGVASIAPVVTTWWLPLHLLIAMISFAVLLMGAVSGVVYLWSELRFKSRVLSMQWLKTPSLPVQERLLSRLLVIGFFGLSLTVATGVLLQAVLGRQTHMWLPLLGWGIYSVVLHSRYLRHQPGRRLIMLSLVGFAVIVASFIEAHRMGI